MNSKKTIFNYINMTFLLTFFFVLVSTLLQMIGMNFISNYSNLTLFNIFTIFISYFIVFFLYHKTTKIEINYQKIFGQVKLLNIIIGLFGGLFIFLLQQFLFYIFIPSNTTVGDNVQTLQNTPTIYMILIAVVIAPIVEELFFRGFFYEISDKTINQYFYCFNSAFWFALLHLQNLDSPMYAIFNLLAVFVSGFVFGLIYRKTNWIGTNIIAHATANGIAIFLILFS